MTEQSPFDQQRPDADLGDALRQVLSARDDATFVRRVMAQVDAVGTATWWGVLGAWARPALAAALVLFALVGFWIGRTWNGSTATSYEDPLSGVAATAGGAPALFDSSAPPSMDVLLAVASGHN